jgi:hypothetical protein
MKQRCPEESTLKKKIIKYLKVIISISKGNQLL